LKRIVTLAVLLEVMGVFAALAPGGPADGGSLNFGQPVLIAFEILLYGVFAYIAVRENRKMLRVAGVAWPFILIGVAALCSTAWSLDPGTTLRRAAVILGTTIIGVYCGASYSIAEFQRLLIKGILIMVAASAVVYLFRPELIIDPNHGGSIQGLTGAKNYFGEYMVLLVILALTCDTLPKPRVSRFAICLLGIVLLMGAHSATALLSLVPVVLLVLPVLIFLRRAPGLAIPMLAVILTLAVVIGSVAAPTMGSLTAAVDRDSTLTGRSNVWAVAWQAIERRPALGYGFDAFWESKRGGLQYERELGWAVPHSHDGYLEMLLGLGVFGIMLLALAIGRTSKDALIYYWRSRGIPSLWPIAFVVALLLHAVTEADLVARHGLPYLVLIVLSIQLALCRRTIHQEVVSTDAVASLAAI
jgi:O-antigen ligase